MVISLVAIVAFLALLFASIVDLKIREVPDLLSYGLLAFAVGFRLITATIFWDYMVLVQGVLGFAVFFGIALIAFYSGQWGGGDAKLLMALGTLFGLELSWDTFMFGLMINILLAGAVYGLCYILYLSFVTSPKREFLASISKTRKMLYVSAALTFVLLSMVLFVPDGMLLLPIAFAPLSLHLILLFVRAVEKTALLKNVSPEKLTEGDWIPEDIYVDGKYICGPKDLGVSKKQIAQLIALKQKKKIKFVPLKEGIPFVPAFFLGYVVTLLWGNWVMGLV